MENFNEEVICVGDGTSTPYIFSLDYGGGVISYPYEDFQWHKAGGEYEGVFDSYLTLKEISDQFEEKYGYLPVLYVLVESALHGVIYQIGNYLSTPYWIKHGDTMGYA